MGPSRVARLADIKRQTEDEPDEKERENKKAVSAAEGLTCNNPPRATWRERFKLKHASLLHAFCFCFLVLFSELPRAPLLNARYAILTSPRLSGRSRSRSYIFIDSYCSRVKVTACWEKLYGWEIHVGVIGKRVSCRLESLSSVKM